jgi:pyrroloquinoline-quinone synthase
MQSFLNKLDQVIGNCHLLNHSFYQRWQRGELSLEELKGYAKEYYAFEKEFPRFLSSLHSRSDNAKMRQSLLENLMHEEYGPNNHPELWLRFAEGMGVARENVEEHIHSDETEHLLRLFRQHCWNGTLEEGLAALYAYESQQPAVATKKIEGLEAFYNIRKESTVAFFKAHEHYDVEHSATEANWLNEICNDEAKQERALAAADQVAKALYDFLDGVERRYRPVA